MSELPVSPEVLRALVQETMAPSEFRLPQRCSDDRRRARRATLALQRESFQYTRDDLVGHPAEGFLLPPYQAVLPSSQRFSPVKMAGVMLRRERAEFNRVASLPAEALSSGPSEWIFERRLTLLHLPLSVRRQVYRWDQDVEFGRLRLAGVNPLALRRCAERPPALLAEAADRVLATIGTSLAQALIDRRLFETSYPLLADARIQSAATHRGNVIAAPTCLFWADHAGDLIPLAIRLRPEGAGVNPVFTPLGDRGAWMLARAHAQAADGHYHEAISHLLCTHLVNEAIAIGTFRQLHPNHPIAQLLSPHFWYTIAINVTARSDLLSVGGPMDSTMATGVPGVLDLARLHYQTWSFAEQMPAVELAARGVDDREVLTRYPYRDDVLELWSALRAYTGDIVAIWYPTEADVAADAELQAWAHELTSPVGSALRGFPSSFTSREQLAEALAGIIYLTSVAHAAVNNGQFENYGFVPNSPGKLRGALPEAAPGASEGPGIRAFWRALPERASSLAQSSMVWVLSEPTRINLYGAGDVPAFQEPCSPASRAAVAALRRRLTAISAQIERRNALLPVPYTYLDPPNIACSTEL